MSTQTDAGTEVVQRPLPPLVPGLPFLGNTRELTKDLMGFIVAQYKRFGPIFRIHVPTGDIVIMAGPEANVFATQEGADKFSSREAWEGYGREFGVEKYIQDIDGEQHAKMRKLFKSSYSANMLLSDIPLLVEIAQNVVNRLQVGKEIPALYLFRLIVTEQLGRALANHAPGNNLDSMIATIRTSLNVHVNKQTPAFMLRMPSYVRAKRRFQQMGRDIVAEHHATSREKSDLVDTVLAASEKDEFKEFLGSEEQILFAAAGPFVAGLDTAANECTYMLYELLKHPDILERCVEEADSLFSQGMPDSVQIRSHGVLHDAMMETLRLHSIAPVINRYAAKTFEFAGYRVDKGQNMLIATTAAHFLPEIFSDPYAFDITRFSEPRKEHKKRGAYYPFGIGAHLCLGAGAAEAQIVLALAVVLHMVRLERVKPEQTLHIKNDPTPTFGYKFRVRVTERRNV
jgi:cytochrome P450